MAATVSAPGSHLGAWHTIEAYRFTINSTDRVPSREIDWVGVRGWETVSWLVMRVGARDPGQDAQRPGERAPHVPQALAKSGTEGVPPVSEIVWFSGEEGIVAGQRLGSSCFGSRGSWVQIPPSRLVAGTSVVPRDHTLTTRASVRTCRRQVEPMNEDPESGPIVGLISFARETVVQFGSGDEAMDPSDAFALACIARCADLLEGQVQLCRCGLPSIARILGRTLIEFWLYGQAFVLEGDAAVSKFLREDARHQGTMEHGRRQIWERLESQRDGGIDLRTGFETPDDAERLQLDVLAKRVRTLREDSGFGGGIAEVTYELNYRWDSAHDVHPTFDLLSRYFRPADDDLVHVATKPTDPAGQDLGESVEAELRDDAQLLADLLGVLLSARGDQNALMALRRRLDAAAAG